MSTTGKHQAKTAENGFSIVIEGGLVVVIFFHPPELAKSAWPSISSYHRNPLISTRNEIGRSGVGFRKSGARWRQRNRHSDWGHFQNLISRFNEPSAVTAEECLIEFDGIYRRTIPFDFYQVLKTHQNDLIIRKLSDRLVESQRPIRILDAVKWVRSMCCPSQTFLPSNPLRSSSCKSFAPQLNCDIGVLWSRQLTLSI